MNFYRLMALLLAGTVSGGAPVRAQVATNYQVFERALEHIAEQASAVLERARDLPIVGAHRSVTQEPAERLLYQKLINALQQQAREIFASADSSANAVQVDFKIVTLEVAYRKLPGGWFHAKRIRREVKAAADFDMQNAHSGVIYFQGVLAAAQADTVAAEAVAQLETPALPFTVGKWQNPSTRGKLWEPVLLAAATGAIVYAFYSLRSQ